MFNGFDYSELYKKWGLYIPDDWENDWELFRLYIEHYLIEMEWKDDEYKLNRVSRAFAKDCRLYLKACAKWETGYEYPVWKALSEIEGDYAFVRLFCPLIGYMWN